ncbi:carbon storage regulator CsrA [Borreliella burgdorferi]|uniref:Translational regulator CsrA n=3 Tax=Borreliella burgdorferi TaxID=139 RepID=CSRA_BORBU|nr:carbon storage regulator CsrA [Borreliella burgdorferi]B7J1B7.1 RecName: Full=Translational regulator CsrA [Borreliella burgdorferi ZS7]O51202.1 RecName: Full=Translational regulator CsrA [Borreliella burgdorferi B31]AGS66204.1 carbon storage regulator [Borreliella burgdorferi CA382]EOA80636.1 carbon storage regulator [Borreliella burgdorferi CA8]AAC66576.1 carbon storage regulator [Borreliella burgdorferi B31]ACK74752.1 carbon storage regulator [Borreliella burgdorferi ZS7]ADQ29269.1 car
MLVLSRKANESIKINSDIEVLILEIKKDAVKIAIKAPENIKIFRSEIYEFIIEENKKSLLKDKHNISKIKSLFNHYFKNEN